MYKFIGNYYTFSHLLPINFDIIQPVQFDLTNLVKHKTARDGVADQGCTQTEVDVSNVFVRDW